MSATRCSPASRSMAKFPAKRSCAQFGRSAPINLARAHDNFLAPGAGLFRFHRVLDVALLEPRAQRLQGGNGVALVIKNHVRRIEIHPDIWPGKLLQKSAEGVGSFLAGLEAKLHSLVGKQIRDERNALEQLLKIAVAGFMRQKSGVKGDEFQPEFFRDCRSGFDVVAVFIPRGIRHHAAGALDGFEG